MWKKLGIVPPDDYLSKVFKCLFLQISLDECTRCTKQDVQEPPTDLKVLNDLLIDVDYLESTVTNSEAPVNDYTQNVSHTFSLTADPEFDQKQMDSLPEDTQR